MGSVLPGAVAIDVGALGRALVRFAVEGGEQTVGNGGLRGMGGRSIPGAFAGEYETVIAVLELGHYLVQDVGDVVALLLFFLFYLEWLQGHEGLRLRQPGVPWLHDLVLQPP